MPRTVLGLLAGAALGLAGTLLQGLTRNPLADPGIMGVNAGAAAAVVGAITLLGVLVGSPHRFAFAGALARPCSSTRWARSGATARRR